MATRKQVAKILVLRGLGYQLEEISEQVGLSVSAVSYQLKKEKEKARDSPKEAIAYLKETISDIVVERKQYPGIPSGTKYVITPKGVFHRLPITGERLPVPDTDELKKLFLDFRGPGRARITDKGEILAYWNEEDPEEDGGGEFDPDHENPDPKAFTHWYIIGTIKDDLAGKIPCIPKLPNNPDLYKPGEIWRGPVDGMRYSVGGKYIFRAHPSYGPRWSTDFRKCELSREVRKEFRDYKPSGGRLYITESNAVITNVDPEYLDADFETILADLNNEQKQYLLYRVEGTNMVPVFLGVHEEGIKLKPMSSIRDSLTESQVNRLLSIFEGGEEE